MPSDDLEEMAIGVGEIYTSPTVVAVDLSAAVPPWVSPVLQPPFANAAENLIEFVFLDEKGVVLRGDRLVDFVEVERGTIAEFDDEKWPKARGRREAKYFREECGGMLLVAAPDDDVVQLHAHVLILLVGDTVLIDYDVSQRNASSPR